MMRNLKNLFIPTGQAKPHNYQYPRKKMDKGISPYPQRENIIRHGKSLLQKIKDIETELTTFVEDEDEEIEGFYLEFVGEPATQEREFKLKLEALEAPGGFQIVSYRKLDNGAESAVLFVPQGKLKNLESKISSAFKKIDPRNIDLVSSINEVKLALLKSLWMSDLALYPKDGNEKFTWEVWIFNNEKSISKFDAFCDTYQVGKLQGSIKFVDRVVRLINCSESTLANIFQYQKIICELRKPADTALPIYDSSVEDQHAWSSELLKNIEIKNTGTELWILDSGISLTNPLLAIHIDKSMALTVNSTWFAHDEKRWKYHGSMMAGGGMYGNLLSKLLSNEKVIINHGLGSVKILPPQGDSLPENYSYLTQQAVSLSEIQSPTSSKIFCMAVTDPVTCKKGEATSWSAAIDLLSIGEDEKKNLFIISAGNVDHENYPSNYPEENELTSIHDPAQSWNSLTVGAFTNLDTIQEKKLSGSFKPLASKGMLSPRSTTSLEWTSYSFVPIKPDIVLEGGNVAVGETEWDEPASLSVLSTNGNGKDVFDYFYGTSSATSHASNMAVIIASTYTEYWPETIRALLIHSADWTKEMNNEFKDVKGKDRIHALLRKYGYGVPSLERALACAKNEVTLISQNHLFPFKEGKNGNIVYNKCHIVDIPWPLEVLRKLGETKLKMKVTLSYFVEPNPSRRGDVGKYQYASHGLRFKTIGPTESEDSFMQRVSETYKNKDIVKGSEDTQHWVVGPDLRTRGSVHSDIWKGTAVELASKSKIAIYPVGGWWKEYKSKNKWNNEIRYSLIISIEGPETAVELYSSVKLAIDTIIENEVKILTQIKVKT